MNNSTWLRTDLHIHSKKSNEIKEADYKGPDYDATTLLKKITSLDNPVKLFSITDHNIINVDLYKNIEILLETDEYKGKLNYIIGVELDIYDKKIYKDRFHTLCFFKSKDVEKIDRVISSFGLISDTDCISDLSKLFDEINKEKLGRFILIPHFNNKSKGLPASLDELDQLTRLIFDAFEDSNNVENIKISLAIYLKEGYNDFPFVAFSDCHDIRNYPKSEVSEDEKMICDVLGTIEYPFDSLKTAFEEPRLRISIKDVDLMRKSTYNNRMIEKLYNDGVPLDISNWLNSIIGPFGSGKSLLIDKVINGIDGIQDKYYSVVDKNTSTFQIEINKVKYSSLNEAISVGVISQIVEIQQEEKLYYDLEIKSDYMINLSKRLGFILPVLDEVDISFDIDKLFCKMRVTSELYSKRSNAYSFKYNRAFVESSGYFVKEESLSFDVEGIISIIKENKINLNLLGELKLRNYEIFSLDEINSFNESNLIMNKKIQLIKQLKEALTIFDDFFTTEVKDFNLTNDISTDKEHLNLVENTLKNFSSSMVELVNCLKEIDNVWTLEKFNTFSNLKNSEDIGMYRVTIEYDTTGCSYYPILKHMYSNTTSSDTFESRFLDSLKNQSTLKGNKEFNEVNIRTLINKYRSDYLKIFDNSNIKYDLIYDKVKNKSITGLSAGGRAKEILKMAFTKIHSNIDKGIKTVVIIDQPENNMDNSSIKKLVVENIKEIKLKDKFSIIQFIIVTHNANVSITSDSENIVIAENYSNTFKYRNGSIENESFINDVCEILEGGKLALKTRAVKYNINILKGMEITK